MCKAGRRTFASLWSGLSGYYLNTAVDLIYRLLYHPGCHGLNRIEGDILVFLPGKEQINTLYDQLDRYIWQRYPGANVTVHRLFRDMASEEHHRRCWTPPRRTMTTT